MITETKINKIESQLKAYLKTQNKPTVNWTLDNLAGQTEENVRNILGYAGKPGYGISFVNLPYYKGAREIPSIGMSELYNPKQSYRNPLGIYTYLFNQEMGKHFLTGNIRFAA